MKKWCLLGVGLLVFAVGAIADEVVEWPSYGGNAGGTRFSPLTEIDRDNVDTLEVAWIYRTSDLDRSQVFRDKAAFECTPIVVDGMMYLTTPTCQVHALDAETGEVAWVYDPKVDVEIRFSEFTNRGVSTWTDSSKAKGDAGYRRLYLGTLDARLICLDAATGEPCSGFGDEGVVDLTEGISLKGQSDYQVTSPPAIIGDVVVVGSALGDNRRVDVEEGVVRAFDARTGKQFWSWDPIPRDDAHSFADTWQGSKARTTGAANVWSIISADADKGLVFLPTTAPSPDHFGGERKGKNVYTNSVVAVRAKTGEVAWHFQVVHHDLWDYDVPCQPVLSSVVKDGEEIPVVIQGTKMGHVFVLHRETGEPVYSVEERPTPPSTIPDEEAWPTQPFPTFPPPLIEDLPQPFEPWAPTARVLEQVADEAKDYRYEGRFTPPSFKGSVQFPSTAGGMNWGGLSYDPERRILVTNMNRFAHIVQIMPRHEFNDSLKAGGVRGEAARQIGTSYGMVRRAYLFNGVPATPPPWGVLVGVDMNTGEKIWEKPLGFVNSLLAQNNWGSPQLGGCIVTKGGLVFVAATMDGRFRAFDIESGEMIWEHPLPVPAQSTPMTYRATADGKQYVVICAGGHGKLGTEQGDYVVAYALP